jgi:hypothetical protein
MGQKLDSIGVVDVGLRRPSCRSNILPSSLYFIVRRTCKHMFHRCKLVDKSEISQQLEPWCCPAFRNHYDLSQVGTKQFTLQLVAPKIFLFVERFLLNPPVLM